MNSRQLPNMLLTLQIALCMGSLQTWANPVTAGQAEQTARKFLASRHRPLDLSATIANSPASVRSAVPQQPLLHVFNVGNNEGFIILSGDDATTTDILAYSDHGTFCYDSLPPNARAWIDGYAEQIADLRKSGAPKAERREVEYYPAIEPMLTCKWGQYEPYNNSCPLFYYGNRTVTGCVATAMAQVLYYHRDNSVDQLQAEIPEYDCQSQVHVGPFYKNTPIDWANMRDEYDKSSSNVEKEAVANLMAYCGAAVGMEYANDGSSASEILIPAAVKKYFGYSSDATIKYRDRFSNDNWERLIYRELQNGRPVILSGSGSAGHAFVCDGYDGRGGYHINWGWDGLHEYDLWCTLWYLRSDYKSYTFNNDVSAVIGLYPGDGTPYEERLTVTGVKVYENYILHPFKKSSVRVYCLFSHQNCTTRKKSFQTRFALYSGSKRIVAFDESVIDFIDMEIGEALGNTNSFYWDASEVEPGNYQFRAESRVKGTDEWLLDEDADKWYVGVIVTNTQVTYVPHQYKEPEINLDDDPMSIATLRSEVPEAIYTLIGRKVGNSAEDINRLPAGIYVIGKRKVLIK